MGVLSDALDAAHTDAEGETTDAHPSAAPAPSSVDLGQAFAVEADLSRWSLSLSEIETLATLGLLIHRILTQ